MSYQGESTDLSDPPGSQILNFTFADEKWHVAALRQSPTVTTVSLDLGPSASWTRLPSDVLAHPEWAVIQILNAQVLIYDGPTTYQARSGPGDIMAFSFAPQLDSGSPTDTLWTIVSWTELQQ